MKGRDLEAAGTAVESATGDRNDVGLRTRQVGNEPRPRHFFVHVSFNVIVRLKTSLPGALSLASATK